MKVCIGGDEYEASELALYIGFELSLLEAEIRGLEQYHELKQVTLAWLADSPGQYFDEETSLHFNYWL